MKTDNIAEYLAGSGFFFLLNSVLHMLDDDSDKWFSRICLASLFFCTYAICKTLKEIKQS